MIAARRITADPRATFRAVSGVVVAAFALTFFTTLMPDKAAAEGERPGGERPGVVTVSTGAVSQDVVAPLVTPDIVVMRLRIRHVGLEERWDSLVACEDLARVRDIACPYDPDLGLDEPTGPVDHLPVQSVYIPTDGSSAAQERVRTREVVAVPNAIVNIDGDPTSVDTAYYADLFHLSRSSVSSCSWSRP